MDAAANDPFGDAEPGPDPFFAPGIILPPGDPFGPAEPDSPEHVAPVDMWSAPIQYGRRRLSPAGAPLVVAVAVAVVAGVLAVRAQLDTGTVATGTAPIATTTSVSLVVLAPVPHVAPAVLQPAPTTSVMPRPPAPPVLIAAPPPGGPSSTDTPRTPVPARPVGDRPDGRPGWSTATGRCDDSIRIPAKGGPPDPELSIAVVPEAATVPSGGSLRLAVTFTNRGAVPLRVFFRTPASRSDAWLLASSDQAASLTLTNGVSERDSVVVPESSMNGGQVTLRRTVRAVRCGDTSSDPAPGLTSSTYLVGAVLDVALSADAPLQPWRAPEQTVVVTG